MSEKFEWVKYIEREQLMNIIALNLIEKLEENSENGATSINVKDLGINLSDEEIKIISTYVANEFISFDYLPLTIFGIAKEESKEIEEIVVGWNPYNVFNILKQNVENYCINKGVDVDYSFIMKEKKFIEDEYKINIQI